MNKIKFPRKENQHYYRYHYTFLFNVFKEAGVNLEMCPSTELDTTRFTINIDGKDVCIDFSDHIELYKYYPNYRYYFKYHYTEGEHDDYNFIYPLGAISFLNWNNYFDLLGKITYKCNNDIILNNQRPYAGALIRRNKVRKILKDKYGRKVDFTLTDQITYWKKINNCLVSVFVPGARNDMLDRGQYQSMAFGACTISPKLNTVLPYKTKLISGYHYIECKADYSDLVNKIEWCKTHRKECVQIGKNAKNLFMAFCRPQIITRWIELCLTK